MTLLVTIFFGSLLGLIGLFGYKQWQINRGIVPHPEVEVRGKRPKLTLRLIEKVFIYWFKIGVQNFALFVVKQWLVGTSILKNKFYKRFPNAQHWFHLKHGNAKSGPASLLLHNVAEYKMNVEKIKRTIRRKKVKEDKDSEETL